MCHIYITVISVSKYLYVQEKEKVMFQPSPEWTQEERNKVMKELFEGIKTNYKRENVLCIANYLERIGRIICSLLNYTAKELEEERDDILWKFAK